MKKAFQQQLTLNFEDTAQKDIAPAQGKKKIFAPIGSMFEKYQLEDKGGYITQEFQDYAYRLAVELDDLAHKSLYMRLAKNTKRALLDQALSFVADAPSVKSKARLFMWKLKQLKEKKPSTGHTSSKPDKTSE